MARFAKGCVFVVSGIFLCAFLIYWATSGAAGTADKFIEHLSNKEINEAYSLLGPAVTKELNREQFDTFLTGTRLGQAKSCFWSSRQVNNGEGGVQGTVQLESGEELELKLVLHKISDEWLIQGIQFPGGSVDVEQAQAVEKLANEFFEAMKSGDFEKAHSLCGEEITKSASVQDLDAMAKSNGFQNLKSLTWGKSKKTNFGERLEGEFLSTDGSKFDVQVTGQQIDGKWLLQGFSFQMQGESNLTPPTDEQSSTLAQSFLTDFGAYMDDKKNLSITKLCVEPLAAKLNQGALDGLIANFPDRKALRAHLNNKFELTEKGPQGNGYRIKGHTAPAANGEYLIFTLDFLGQKGTWALYNLDLRLFGNE